MNEQSTLITQYNYHVWATKQVIEHLKKLPSEIYDKEIQSVFPSISKVLGHIYRVDAMWLAVMAGESFEKIMASIPVWTAEVEGISLEGIEEKLQGLSDKYLSFLSRQEDPQKPLTLSHPQYGSLKAPLSEALRHVINHGTFHRGNISAMLRQMGEQGVPTDYIFYLYTLQAAK